MNIINLTPHPITIRNLDDNGEVNSEVTLAPSGTVARLNQSVEIKESIPVIVETEGIKDHMLDILVGVVSYGGIEGLPPYQDGIYYVVSSMVASAVNRRDVFAPDTGPDSVIRNASGQIEAVQRLLSFPVMGREGRNLFDSFVGADKNKDSQKCT